MDEKSSQVRRDHVLLPVLWLRDVSLFPEASLRLGIARPSQIKATELAIRTSHQILVLAQKDPDIASPSARDLHTVGTIAELAAATFSPEGGRDVELDGLRRGRVHGLFGVDVLIAEVELLDEGDPGDEWGAAVEALARYLHTHAELRAFIDRQRRSTGPMAWVNLACQHVPITASARQKLLESDAAARCLRISRGLDALLRKEKTD